MRPAKTLMRDVFGDGFTSAKKTLTWSQLQVLEFKLSQIGRRMDYSIGHVTKQTGVSADTLRYYERIRLLPPVRRNTGGQRRYSEQDLSRLRFIRRAQSMDFSLHEIADLLVLRERPGDVRSEVRTMTERKLADIDRRIASLTALRSELAVLVDQCRTSETDCPIIHSMNTD